MHKFTSHSLKLVPVMFVMTLLFFSNNFVSAKDTAAEDAAKEKELIAVLQSDAPEAEKAITCKLLAIHGSANAVPELAKLLPNPRLTSWARIALESIPGPEADEALRNASETLEGRILIGVLNSIGFRQDAGAVELLTGRLTDKDEEVASAAAVSLGKIGNAEATASLQKSLSIESEKVRSAVAEGAVLCAEKLLASGNAEEAVKLFDEIRNTELPKQRLIEATRGAILARGDDGIPLLLDLLDSTDKKMFQLSLVLAREFPGSKVDSALAEKIFKAKEARAALILTAMTDRTETVQLMAVLKAAEEGAKPLRLAALTALGKIGDATCLTTLLEAAQEEDADLNFLAKLSLASLQGEGVDEQIVALLSKSSEESSFPVLIQLVGQRRINATPVLVKALDHSNAQIKLETLKALGETVSQKELNILTSAAIKSKQANEKETAAALQALKTASVRMPDREACAAELTEAFLQSPSTATKVELLKILGAVGGTNALATIGSAAKTSDDSLQDSSTQLLGRWMTADAAPVLLDLSTTAPGKKYQVRAMRGYIRIARQFTLSAEERAEMCRKALDTSNRAEERKMVLGVLQRYPNLEMLQIALNSRDDDDISNQATTAAIFIAQKLGTGEKAVADQLSKEGLKKMKVEILKAEYGSDTTKKDVTARLQKLVKGWPVIILPKGTYNKSLGGDPAPGMTKKLIIKYRIDGKAGEATFPEGATISLPVSE